MAFRPLIEPTEAKMKAETSNIFRQIPLLISAGFFFGLVFPVRVCDHAFLDPSAAGELVKIITGIHTAIQTGQNRRGRDHTILGQAHTAAAAAVNTVIICRAISILVRRDWSRFTLTCVTV